MLSFTFDLQNLKAITTIIFTLWYILVEMLLIPGFKASRGSHIPMQRTDSRLEEVVQYSCMFLSFQA